MATQPIAIGGCTAESETLDKLLQLGITKQSNEDETIPHKTESEKGCRPSTSQCDVTMTAETSSNLPSAEEKSDDIAGMPSTINENPSLPDDSAVPKTSTHTNTDDNKTMADAEQNEPPHTPNVNIQEDSVPVPSVDMDKTAPTTSKNSKKSDESQLQLAETSKKNDQAQQSEPANSSLSPTELNYVLNNQPKVSLKWLMQAEIPVPGKRKKLDKPTKPSVPGKLSKSRQHQTQQFKFRLSQHGL